MSRVDNIVRAACVEHLQEVAKWASVRGMSFVAAERLRVADHIRRGGHICKELALAGQHRLTGGSYTLPPSYSNRQRFECHVV